jgi:phosphotransferase system  glucose/maltose/N-acetylglucosamine-specific IIC component
MGDDRSHGTVEWVLVAAVVVAFLVLPIVVVFLPAAQSGIRALGLTLRDAYLVLPLVPALVLGAIAVWSAVRARRSGQH